VRIAGKKKTCIYVEEKVLVCKCLVNRDPMLKTQSAGLTASCVRNTVDMVIMHMVMMHKVSFA